MMGTGTFLTQDKINIRESPYACITYIMNNSFNDSDLTGSFDKKRCINIL